MLLLGLLALGVPFYAQWGSFYLQEYQLKQQMRARLPELLAMGCVQRLEVSQVAYEGLSWKDGGREFVFQGQMYDLVRKQTAGGRWVLWCVPDHQETELHHRWRVWLHQTYVPMSPSSSTQQRLLLFVKSMFWAPSASPGHGAPSALRLCGDPQLAGGLPALPPPRTTACPHPDPAEVQTASSPGLLAVCSPNIAKRNGSAGSCDS